jgi:uncharacterized protein (DUF885 family)
MLAASLSALALVIAAPAAAGPTEDFHKVVDDHWQAWLRNNPINATLAGVSTYDSEIGSISLAQMDKQTKEAQGYLDRLKAIDPASLTPADRVNYAILKRLLSEAIEANGFGERQMLFSTLGSFHQMAAELPGLTPFNAKADYDHYLDRIEKYPALNAEAIAVTRGAVKGGFVQPCAAMKGYDQTISGVIAEDPAKSRFYAPFGGQKPGNISEADWAALQTRARTIITTKLNPAYAEWNSVYLKEVAPKCRATVGASTLPQGKAYYAFQVRQITTTTMTPDQIHTLGLSEVARIGAEMDALAKQLGFATRAAYVAKLHSDPKYYAKTPEELLGASALLAKTIDGKMPTLFGRLPRLPYGIKPVPAETAETNTTAYYMPGSVAAGIAGTYYVNTSHLDQRPLWELPALTAHEAVPGHHNQIALQQEVDIPDFRKNEAYFTAFVEGWGLYSEHLAIELGIYDTPEKNMGRLSYEMWRACRLVVDTGMHAMGWTKEQAVAFMKQNTALTDKNIDAEVNRYISNPGQALAYKIGELKFRELRKRAEDALGAKFDERRFHDAALAQGPVPLDVLDQQINDWIAAEKAKG